MSELWERIRAARASASLTQEEMAEKLGVARPTIGVWETPDPSKRSKPREKMLRRIAEVTGAPYKWLVSDNSEIDPEFILQNPDLQSKNLEHRLKTQRQSNRKDLERALLELHTMVIEDTISYDDAEVIIALVSAIKGRVHKQ
ncbi:XRE family transcriptional regulator [Endozoicomonas sp. SM1973]|uniref:XRE family transcriptional regulator n=1 Tax=Spartinivicinus marinus TaxID=2994442 RepID=A0A853IA68_9GAMM|nr:helix-turn-helix transcriptional regulator [Spartinivicinus marinus]MCX4027903.1 helix-turn-helix domain-containing protein [Spartinivicinus marinus]NYZ70193.1 XRE family transcriptional regulator [Spartinivicinus marinus]